MEFRRELFSSDNGPENCTLELKETVGHYSSGPFRGHKQLNFEGGHRIPTFVVWPGGVKPGGICKKPVNQVDFYATCADIVGHKMQPDEAVDSWSFLSALKGNVLFERGETMVHQNYQGRLAIRKGNWIMMLHPAWKGMLSKYHDIDEPAVLDPSPYQLYHLLEDVNERNNLASEYPERMKEMQSLLKKMLLMGVLPLDRNWRMMRLSPLLKDGKRLIYA